MKILSPNQNFPIPQMRKVLWVAKPTYFHPRWETWLAGARVGNFDFYKLSFSRKVLVSPSVIEHQKTNPRSVEYLLESGFAFFRETAPEAEIDLLLDKNEELELSPALTSQFRRIWAGQNQDFRSISPNILKELSAQGYDTIIFLYADSIGRGWLPIENRMRNLGADQILVLNGRKRVFLFDRETHTKLLWRRFLERTWLAELILAPFIFILSIPLALYDLTFRKLMRAKR